MKNPYLRNHLAEGQLFRNRVLVASIVIIAFFCLLAVRLYYLQIQQFTTYSTLSEQNRVTLLPVTPNRGLIYDRNGILLVENVPAYSLQIIPEKVDNIASTVAAIKAIIPITEDEEKNFYQQLKLRRRFEGVPLKVNLDEETAAKFSVNSYQFPGVKITAELMRYYPYQDAFSHSIGYVGRINQQEIEKIDPTIYSASLYIGKTGIEQFYETELRGMPGYQHAETNVRGRIVRMLKNEPPTHGNDLHLTMDYLLQRDSIAAMEGKRGTVIALDPNDGGILAFISAPGFDPNLFVEGIGQETYQELLNSWERPLFNRLLRGQYPPASTVKPIIALQALELNYVTPEYTISDPGFYRLPNVKRAYRDWRKEGHGRVNLHKAIVESCDTYFYTISNRMGIDPITDIMKQFGFGKPTGIDLIGELSGVAPGKDWKRANLNEPWYPGETLITSIGQGFTLTTPLQLAQMSMMLANRGARIQPRLVDYIETPTGDIIKKEPVNSTSAPPKNSAHWDLIQQSVRDVVGTQRGTAHRIDKSPYAIAGKTGTAQVFSLGQNEKYNANLLDERLRDHSLFVGYAPADNPQIAVAIVLENNTGAADVAQKVIDSYLARMSE
ncbi:MAG: penicillin-binding protein 2 [Gammaproteobacteria bacterium]|jgi:penicillin-binding protein 2